MVTWAASVARVLGPGSAVAGAGFLVADDILVTCAHVVEAAGVRARGTLRMEFPQAEGAPGAIGEVIHLGRGALTGEDVAVVRLAARPPGTSPLPLAGASGCRGHRVRSFGFPAQAVPGGHYGYGHAGEILSPHSEAAALLQLNRSNDLTQGFSGGPVWDDTVEAVIGMVTRITRPDPHLRGTDIAYATPVGRLRELWPELAVRDVCPYRGLQAFTTEHAGWFHGRTEAVRRILDRLWAAPDALLLLGPSGAGKSSLVQAGVVPALAASELPGSDCWEVVTVRPGPALLDALEAVGRPVPTGVTRRVLVVDQFEEILQFEVPVTPPSPPPGTTGESTTGGPTTGESTAGEETTGGPTTGETALRTGLDRLTAAIGTPGLTVLLVMRDDFYPQLAAEAPDLLAAVTSGLVNVPATLSPQDLHDIIVKPADEVGARCQEGLPKRIIADVLRIDHLVGARQLTPTTVLPLVEVAMSELWKRSRDGVLTHEAYERIGGLSGSINAWYDNAMASLPPTDAVRRTTQRVLTALVRPPDPARGIPALRRQVPLPELRELAGDGGTPPDASDVIGGRIGAGDAVPRAVDQVLAVLVEHRLIVTRGVTAHDEPVAELVHDALIRDWGVLRGWVEQNHRFQEWLDRAADQRRRWQERHDNADLLRGSDLADGLSLSAGHRLPRVTADFLRASRRAVRRAVWARRAFTLGLVLLTLAAGAMAGVALDSAAEARAERAVALSRQLAAQSRSIATAQPVTARRLAVAAWSTAHTTEAGLAMTTLLSQQQSTLVGHSGALTAAVFSPDGARIATTGDDGTVRLWDTATGRAEYVRPGAGRGRKSVAVAFRPDGRMLASADEDGAVRLWDVRTGKQVGAPLAGHTDRVNSVAFSPDGALLASGGWDGAVRLWDPATGKQVGAPLAGHTSQVNSVAFSPDGALLASGGWDGTVRLWDPATGKQVGTPLRARVGSVRSVAFRPDGGLLAAAAGDGTIQFWNPGSGKPVGEPLRGHTEAVLSVTFSPNGKMLASTGQDGTVRLWDQATGKPVASPMIDHNALVWSASFSPEGDVLVSAGADGTARLWDPATGRPAAMPAPARSGRLLSVAMTPVSTLVASAEADHSVQLRDPRTGSAVGVPLRGHTDDVLVVAADPKARIVATAGNDGTVRLWNPYTGKEITNPLTGDWEYVSTMAFSPDGTLLATAGSDATVRIWNTATGEPTHELRTKHEEFVNVVAFTPDGGRLATAGADSTVGFWDPVTGRRTGEITTGYRYAVEAMAFSPAGTRIAVGSTGDAVQLWDVRTRKVVVRLRWDGRQGATALSFDREGDVLVLADPDRNVRLWDPSVGRQLGESLTGHQEDVGTLAFTRDGTFLTTADKESLARVWYVPVPRVAATELCARFGTPTTAEWRRYAPGEPQPSPCHAGGPDASTGQTGPTPPP